MTEPTAAGPPAVTDAAAAGRALGAAMLQAGRLFAAGVEQVTAGLMAQQIVGRALKGDADGALALMRALAREQRDDLVYACSAVIAYAHEIECGEEPMSCEPCASTFEGAPVGTRTGTNVGTVVPTDRPGTMGRAEQ